MGNYDDIINLPHHRSKGRKHMSLEDRAAQFAPFAALSGYEESVGEEARLVDARIELSESAKAELNECLQELQAKIGTQPEVTVTYYRPDERKPGGAYLTVRKTVKRLDVLNGTICFTDGTDLPMEDIYRIGDA